MVRNLVLQLFFGLEILLLRDFVDWGTGGQADGKLGTILDDPLGDLNVLQVHFHGEFTDLAQVQILAVGAELNKNKLVDSGQVDDFLQGCLFIILEFEELLVKFLVGNADVLIRLNEDLLGMV